MEDHLSPSERHRKSENDNAAFDRYFVYLENERRIHVARDVYYARKEWKPTPKAQWKLFWNTSFFTCALRVLLLAALAFAIIFVIPQLLAG